MQHDDRQPVRLAALFDIDAVAVANIHQTLIERLDLRIKIGGCALLPCDPVHDRTI